MDVTFAALVLAVGTLVLAVVTSLWALPRSALPGPLRAADGSREAAAPTGADAAASLGPGAPGKHDSGGADARGSKSTHDDGRERRAAAAEGPHETERAEEAGARHGASGLGLHSSDGLWVLRVVAVQRTVDHSIFGGSVHPEALLAVSLKRRIWAFMDDRLRFVASGCADGQARVFDLRTGRLLVSVRHDTADRRPLTALLLTPGPVLFTGSWDGRRHAWDVWPRKPGRPTEFARGERGVGHDNSVTGIALSRDGNLLACACTTGCILVYRAECPSLAVTISDGEELEDLQESLKLGDHGDFYLKEDITLGGVHIEQNFALLPEADFSGCKSRREVGKLKLPALLHFRFSGCLTRGNKRAWRRLEHDAAVLCLSLSAEGCQECLYSGSRDQTVRKWELLSGRCMCVYRGHTSMVRCLAVNGRYLASGGDDRTVRVWQRDAPAMLRCLAGHADFVRGVALCPTFPERLVSAGDDLRAILWNADTGERLRDFTHGRTITAVVVRESILATAAEDGRLRLWRIETGAVMRQLAHPDRVCAISVL
uniref:Anaphase-promoting complex subunit 4 WD40 domain-containing protein n=1 Tax=Alexandrium monilatum TaxID=311494 RepID=A0A7S4PRY6_9DINO|mmetsp:Transcript_72511/g.216342  ORF Transcript_72511/g.216342 Transcript_72511/m.216342 type:complete len:542 (-) Transcript_72511:105-1730(-)